MSSMILPLLVVLVAALLVLGMVIAERYPISTWKDQLQRLREIAAEKNDPVRVVPQEARLEDLMTHDESSVYTGTESFSGLVDVVERAMDSAESRAASLRRR
ncbi:hypothetical protein [Actinomyces faecalis]|uniref:hypothetical protein n=1 Tax=Actinomyces faecalis TaxID=2722820 RepID=UPI00155811BE|nr:hypothetical protein [Actinomyces faecalis]